MENVICGVSMLLVVILLAKNTNFLTNFAKGKQRFYVFSVGCLIRMTILWKYI